jgi:hypothetical protein
VRLSGAVDVFEMKKHTVEAFLDISKTYHVWCDARKGATFGNNPICVEPTMV